MCRTECVHPHLRGRPQRAVIAKKIRHGGCESYIFHRDVPRNCAQLSPRALAAQTYFRTRRFPIKGSGEIHRRSNLHLHQGRLVGFGIVQGHIAAFLADDIKSNLFQRSHQFSRKSGRRLARSGACRCRGAVGRAPRSLSERRRSATMKLEIESSMPAAEGGTKTRTDVAAIRDAIVDKLTYAICKRVVTARS